MKPQISRSVTVWLLLVVFMASLMPSPSVSGANKVQTTSQQSSSQSPRRSRNGGASSASQPKSTDSSKDDAKTGDSETRSTTTAGDDEKKNQEKDSPKTFEDERLNRQKEKKEPLPFDRPPLGNDSSANSSSKSTPSFDRPASSQPQKGQPQRGANTDSSSTDSQPTYSTRRPSDPGSSRYPSTTTPPQSQPGWEKDEEPARRNGPPVLRREPDSPNRTSGDSENGGRGAPPVLTRPNDPRNTNPGSSNPPPRTTGQPTTNNSSGNDDDPIKLEGTLVNIPILVSDRSNRYISQLTARDFQMYEDGVQQEVAFFGNEEVPFSVALLLDMSPSVADNQTAIQDAAVEFVRQLRPDDRVMVVSFDRRIDFLTDFTSDRRLLERAIRSTQTGSGTSVYEAVYRTISQRLRNVEGRKAMFLFSDGEDTTSRGITYDDAINIVEESDVLVYGLRFAGTDSNIQVNPWPRNPVPNIQLPFPFPWPMPRRRGGHLTTSPNPGGTNTGQWPRRGRGDFMTDVTTAGGGPVFNADTLADYRGLAIKIAEELRHVYVVSYYPTNALSNGGYRAIRVRVKNRDDIAVRHRKGYNAKDMAKGI